MMATGPTTPQVTEVSEVKEKYGTECRIIKDVGEFSHVVNIRPSNIDVTFKFQLPGSYPGTIPVVIVRSQQLAPSDQEELQVFLNTIANKNLGKAMIETLYNAAGTWLKNRAIDLSMKEPEKPKKSGKKQKKSKKKVKDESVGDEKLTSMKTSEDVISRILWDGNLQADMFKVGYLDRFLGIMEKAFTAFSWEDIASVDYTVLAIPKHRIQYFKYKDLKVWDKNARLDNFFGSTGSNLTILDVIKEYEEMYSGHASTIQNQPKTESDDEDDDDIEINLGEASAGGYNMEEDFAGDDYDPHWQNKTRPNYFLCIRITNREVMEGVAAMQDAILETEPRYGECVIPPASLHVTLCTLGLDTADQIAEASHILKKAQAELSDIAASKINITMDGVDNFYKRVLYAKVHHEEDFMVFVNHLKVVMKEGGIDIRDNYDFVPHMTIMKTTRPVSRVMNTKDITPAILTGFTDMYFGSQTLDAIHLCAMTAERQEDGFYITPQSIKVVE